MFFSEAQKKLTDGTRRCMECQKKRSKAAKRKGGYSTGTGTNADWRTNNRFFLKGTRY
jgi:hypothetical protein